jgi:chromosomal replication initiator protein
VNEGEKLWASAAKVLRDQVSASLWLSTFQDVKAVGLSGSELRLRVPSTMVRELLVTRFRALVDDALRDAGREDLEVVVEVAITQPELALDEADITLDDPLSTALGSLGATTADGTPDGRSRNGQGASDLTAGGLNPRYTFETFVKGQSNEFALAAALRVAETPARSYNPLFIYGAAGLGKTHLLHAIGHYVSQQYSDYEIRYVSTESFLNEYIDAIRTTATAQFKRRYREVDVLLIDDIQFMEGKEGLQEEFFHTFNSLHGANKQIVISSDRVPDNIAMLEDRLRGRFKWGLITDIQPPDLETRLAILRNKAERDRTAVPPDVLELIANRVTNNIRELEGALIRVTAYASLSRATLDVGLADRLLADILQGPSSRAVSSQVIIDEVADYYNQPVEALRGKSRQRPLVLARQIAMYLIRQLTDLSYPAIAREFGGRDHTTVMHAVDKVQQLMKERQLVYDQVGVLMTKLKNGQ